ncbi:tetratricopeptide repeat protein [Nonlabens ulvanivorans]
MKIRLTILVLAFATIGFAQKKELKNIKKAILSQDYDKAAEIFNTIDPASVEQKYKADYELASGVITLEDPFDIKVSEDETFKAIESFRTAKKLNYDGDVPLDNLILNAKQRLVDIANKSVKEENFNQGYDIMTSLYDKFPQDTIWLYQAASLAQASGDLDGSLAHLEELINMGYTGQNVQYFAYSIETGDRVNWTQSAIQAGVKSGVLKNPGTEVSESKVSDITKSIAMIYAQKGDREKALNAIQQAKESNPNDKSLMINEASIYLDLGMMDKYRTSFDNLLNSNIDEVGVFVNLGIKASESKKYDDAVKAFSKALALDPDNYSYATAATQTLMDADDQLTEDVNKLIKSGGSNEEIMELKEMRINNIKSVVSYAEKAHQIDPSKKDIINVLVYYYEVLKDKEKVAEFKAKM